MQQITDVNGVLRFRENLIVSHILANCSKTLNDIASMDFSQEDREQFAQLIGYSVSGYGDLSYVSDESVAKADYIVDNIINNTPQSELESERDLYKDKYLELKALFDKQFETMYGV